MTASSAKYSQPVSQPSNHATIYPILFAISLVHLFNDSIQAVIPAIFPILQTSMGLTYTQLGWIGFALSFTASIMQPVIGIYSDKKPSPFFLPLGMLSTLIGMLALAYTSTYLLIVASVIFVGIGSAVFHPEASRVAYLAAGNRRGLAQSIFQVGGNIGHSLAPLMTVIIFLPLGQKGALIFSVVAAAAIFVLMRTATWYGQALRAQATPKKNARKRQIDPAKKKQLTYVILLLVFIVFARSWYTAAIGNYYVFYLQDLFNISTRSAQFYIFCFLGAGAIGTFFGGPLSDWIGRKNLMAWSMLIAAPLALIVPYANTFWSYILLFLTGLIMLSSFSVSVVYAQELIPGKIGTASGLITGFAFGMGGVGAIAIGSFIDLTSIRFAMQLCSLLPLLGLLAFLLPHERTIRKWQSEDVSNA